MRLRTVIIDDETHVRRTLSAMLAEECPNMDVVGTADGGFLVISNNDRVPVASCNHDELMEIFQKLCG